MTLQIRTKFTVRSVCFEKAHQISTFYYEKGPHLLQQMGAEPNRITKKATFMKIVPNRDAVPANTPEQADDRWYSIEQLRHYLGGVSGNFIRARIEVGDLDAVDVGTPLRPKLRVRQSAADAFMDNRRVRPRST